MVTTTYIAGLDLGQTSDYTALCVLERVQFPTPNEPDADAPDPIYTVRHLERFELGTSYPAIGKRVQSLVNGKAELHGCQLAVDQTGVGRAVVDILRLLRMECGIVPITITGGHTASEHDDGWHVPKKDLVGAMQVLLSSRRFKVPKILREAETLVKELQNFKVKITASANETFGEWRDGAHDDLVLSCALSTWVGENLSYPVDNAFGGLDDSNRIQAARAPKGVWYE